MDTILVLDFGGQTCQLIARRIRECGVFARVVPGDIQCSRVTGLDKVKGIILSGSPASVYDDDAPLPDFELIQTGVPVLGICYGMQQLMEYYGGGVSQNKVREYGRAQVEHHGISPLFLGVPTSFNCWMSHSDGVDEIAPGFHQSASSENSLVAAVESISERHLFPIYGIQFHPEVSHTEYGQQILENFATSVCGAHRSWDIQSFQTRAVADIRRTVDGQPVVVMVSGGIDSTVVAALLLKALSPEQVNLLYVDTGLMRMKETSEIKATLSQLGATNVKIVDAADQFYSALAGKTEPEEKRRIIGDLFIKIQEATFAKHLKNSFLAQGTLYTDLVESGYGVGNKAEVIKTHHNVSSPLVEKIRTAGQLIEPLATLYKDEVRRLGEALSVPSNVIKRHPFPGPGLAVRIMGEITRERCRILRSVDAIYLEELQRRNLYGHVTQAFSVLLPVRSVGVTGDSRNYGVVVALRAVVSDDFMTAEVYRFEMSVLLSISDRITNEVKEVGRVVYDISSKPPATIEWE